MRFWKTVLLSLWAILLFFFLAVIVLVLTAPGNWAAL